MAQYTVQAPDGQTITLEGPDGASQADVISQAQKLYQPKGSVQVMSPEGAPLNTQFGETGGGAAVGRPQGINRTNVLPEPRPTESLLAGATKSVIDPAVAGAQVLTGGRLGTSELAQKLGEQGQVYSEENPDWYFFKWCNICECPRCCRKRCFSLFTNHFRLFNWLFSDCLCVATHLL